MFISIGFVVVTIITLAVCDGIRCGVWRGIRGNLGCCPEAVWGEMSTVKNDSVRKAQMIRTVFDSALSVHGGRAVGTLLQFVSAGDICDAYEDDDTLLHVCARDARCPSCCSALLATGADPTARNRFGRTPIDVAASPVILEKLLAHKK
jgi:hypothetical protein